MKPQISPISADFWLKLYLAAMAAFFASDMLWLGVIARAFYARQIGHLMAPQVNWTAAMIFYLLFIAGLLIFVVIPGLQADSFRRALRLGALYGLLTYATYDLTNMATLRDWPLTMTLVDIAWGVTLSSLVTSVAYWVGKRLPRPG